MWKFKRRKEENFGKWLAIEILWDLQKLKELGNILWGKVNLKQMKERIEIEGRKKWMQGQQYLLRQGNPVPIHLTNL